MLNLGLKRIYKNKAELLLVLERPEILTVGTPLPVKKTCRKLGISFCKYLLDRISKSNEIPPLPELILHYANVP